MHPIVRTPAVSHLRLAAAFALALVSLWSPASARADESPGPLVVSTPWPGPAPSTEPSALTPLQRLSIERGAADLGGASEQALLSATLYVSSAATLVGGIATLVVLFTELAPPSGLLHSSGWGAAELGALGAGLLCFAAHAVTTPLAIVVGREAQRRHERARRALLLVDLALTPSGATLVGRF